MFKNSNFDGIAEETNGYAQKEMDPASIQYNLLEDRHIGK